MSQPWSEITSYFNELASGKDGDPFWLACREVGTLATRISQTRLNASLFGWTSMHDLCIQQLDVPPFSGPYLRISPMRTGCVEFRLIDTHVADRQWHREVAGIDTIKRFVEFLNQLQWMDQNEAVSLLQ